MPSPRVDVRTDGVDWRSWIWLRVHDNHPGLLISLRAFDAGNDKRYKVAEPSSDPSLSVSRTFCPNTLSSPENPAKENNCQAFLAIDDAEKKCERDRWYDAEPEDQVERDVCTRVDTAMPRSEKNSEGFRSGPDH